ncbi:MAG: NADH-quinone oxidoreductase subunit NuoE [Candidatus Cloacimonetes bacterium]|nr:NADH-quinone oxidoreductase subunit NuoE [Candidatus Cloacimonadota bacterium]
MRKKINNVFKAFSKDEENLIPILQKIQAEIGYISIQAVEEIANFLRITEGQVYGVASFYSQFRFTPRGRHSITVCLGTACHVRGGEILIEALERDLEVKTGECTEDKRFDLNRVACLGCCALAPVVKIDEDIYSNVTIIKLKEVLEKYE